MFNEGKMTDELTSLYNTIFEEQTSKKDLDNRILDIEEEESFLLDKMQELCGSVQYSKQISNFNLQVKKIDEEVDELLKNIAVEFVSPFLDEASKDVESSDLYSDDIEEIRNLKLQVETIDYNIEYCNLSTKKDSISSKITYMTKAIENCKNEIKNYEQRIEKLKEDIENSNQEKQEIDKELSKLEILINEGK